MLYSVFFVRARIGPKKWGGQFDPPPGNPRIGQHPGKGGVKTFVYIQNLFLEKDVWREGGEKTGFKYKQMS